MKRFTVPTDNELYHQFDTKVPHGIKATLIRGLIRIALESEADVMWAIAQHEGDKGMPDMFELKKRPQ